MTGRAPDNGRHADWGRGEATTVGALWARVRRYWVLVLVITWVAALGAYVATQKTPTTYVGRTSLIVSSTGRSPDQDAVLVQGYIAYFNDASYQRQLLRTAGVRGDVSLSAEAAAASPIVVVSATTNDPSSAQQDAITVAKAFQDDINRVHAESAAQERRTLQDQLDTALASKNPDAQSVVIDLQNQIQKLQADQVDVLKQLQAQGGVSVHGRSLLRNLVPAVAGGLLLGLLVALVLAGMSRRLRNPQDVADKLGLHTLVELPGPRRKGGRVVQAQRLGQLANIARARLSGPGVVAVAQPEAGSSSSVVARELAEEWARQGYPTVLVTFGTGGFLDGRDSATPRVRTGHPDGLSLLQLAPRSADGAPVLSVSKVGEFLEQEALAGQYVVIAAPAVAQSAAAQAICQAADQTIIVVDRKASRVAAAREAVVVLSQMGTVLMGAVLTTSLTEDEGEAAETEQTPTAGLSDVPPVDDVQRASVADPPSGVSRGARTGRE